MWKSYRDILTLPGAWTFTTAAFIARLPIAMISLGIVLLVSANSASYALAGTLSAVFALSMAFLAPIGARLVDRWGQSQIVPILGVCQLVGLLSFVFVATAGGPLAIQVICLIVAGGIAPNYGSLVRARWAHATGSGSSLRTAFALEAVVDEIVFIVGPPLVTVIALGVSESAGLIACAILLATGGTWFISQRRTAPPAESLRHLEKGKQWSWAFVIVVAVMSMMGVIFASFEVTTVAFSAAQGAEVWTGVALASYAFGSLLVGVWVGARHSKNTAAQQLPYMATLLAVVTLILPLVPNMVSLFVLALLAGMTVSPVLISATVLVEEIVATSRLTEALTITISGVAVGLAAGATVAGFIVDTYSANSGYWVVVIAGFIAALLSLSTRRVLIRAETAGTIDREYS